MYECSKKLATCKEHCCFHYSDFSAHSTWVLVSSGTQVQPQVILDPDYLPDYLSVSYDCDPLNLWTPNDLTVKDSFNAANKLQEIPKKLFDSG